MEKKNIFYEDKETGIIVDTDGNFEFPINESTGDDAIDIDKAFDIIEESIKARHMKKYGKILW